MTTNETMAVTTPQPPPLNEITFTITTPTAPLFLGTLKINAFPPGANGVIGSVDPGGADAQHPALHVFKMGAKFQQIRQFLINNQGTLSIQITYESSNFLASNLNVMAMLMAATG
jgi:hypothetical protein